MKRIYLLLTAIIFLPGLVMAQNSVSDEFMINGIRYEITSSNTLQVIAGGDYIVDITIPSNVTYQNVDYTVTAIGEKAFWDCVSLKSVDIPSSVTSIGKSAFHSCVQLTSIEIPNSVNSIGNFAFSDCIRLNSIYIPASVTFIGMAALSTRVGISSICNGLTFNVDANNPAYLSEDNVLYNKEKTSLLYCSPLHTGSFEIPNTVVDIGPEAFVGCSNLTSISIPESVYVFEAFSIAGCNGLKSLYVYYSKTLPSLEIIAGFGPSVFAFLNKSTITLYVPAGSKNLYQGADEWKEFNIVEMEKEAELVTAVTDSKISLPVKIRLINSDLEISNTEFAARLSLFDLTGRMVYESALRPYETTTVNALRNGVYIVRVSDGNDMFSKKIVIP